MKALAIAYLVAYAAVTSVVLGALALVMIAHLTGATWFVVLRRRAEAIVAALPWLAVLFVPLLLAAPMLYPWADPGSLDPARRAFVESKGSVLTIRFFALRSAVYLGTWMVLGELLRRASLRQDREPDRARSGRQIALSAVGLPLVGLTLTFAAFDWLMTLALPWQSTVYGLYWFAGGLTGALALIALLEPRSAGPDHRIALGKLLLTSVMLWAYLGYAQLLIMWIGDLPREVSWYLPRLQGPWAPLGLLLLAGHFGVPFLLLLSRGLKRSRTAIGLLGGWLLLMHYLDSLWLLGPGNPQSLPAHLLALALIGGSAALVIRRRARGHPPIPLGDPELPLSIRYQSP